MNTKNINKTGEQTSADKTHENKSAKSKYIYYWMWALGKLNFFLVPEDDEANYRIISVLSYFVVLIVIGLPIWWYTTRVYRANLPLAEIEALKLENINIDKEYGVPLSLEYDILISFVHPDPQNLNINLQGEDIDLNLQSYLKKLPPLANFVVKSQWLYLTDLGVLPIPVGDYNVLEEHQLSQVITPLETKLWSNISPRPVINFVVYFPHCLKPLFIVDKDRKRVESNAFLSPRWGGILIINPDKDSCISKNFTPELETTVSVFTTLIKQLFKIGNVTNPEDIYDMKVKKSNELLLSTHRTLKSLAQLLSEISSIVISDDVGDKINDALINANLAESNLKSGKVDQGLEKAKIAFAKSEDAFSDPSLLALLYFPEDQK